MQNVAQQTIHSLSDVLEADSIARETAGNWLAALN
jgi:hypothetical protein